MRWMIIGLSTTYRYVTVFNIIFQCLVCFLYILPNKMSNFKVWSIKTSLSLDIYRIKEDVKV